MRILLTAAAMFGVIAVCFAIHPGLGVLVGMFAVAMSESVFRRE